MTRGVTLAFLLGQARLRRLAMRERPALTRRLPALPYRPLFGPSGCRSPFSGPDDAPRGALS
jgi:hypothetical protein